MSDDPRRRQRAGERRRVALRGALLQSAWNYETLQAVGFAWALLPGLRRLYPDREARARRVLAHLEVFNSNPYLATIGLGVALRLEEEVARGATGAERRLARLLRALRGSLGAIGDDLFWAAWRPALALAATLAVLAGAGAWPAVAFLLAYNALAQGVRLRGVRAGFAAGAGIARVLQDSFWRRTTRASKTSGAAVAGAALGAGAAWGFAGGGGEGVGVFLGVVALLSLASLRPVADVRPLSPALAFFVAVAILSVLHSWTGSLPG